MKKLNFILMISLITFLASCSAGSGLSYNKNTGFSNKKISTIAKSKGGRIFCRH